MRTGLMVGRDRIDLRSKVGVVASKPHVTIDDKRDVALPKSPADMLARFVLDDTAQDDRSAWPLHDQTLEEISYDPLGMHGQSIVPGHANGMNRAGEDEIDVPRIVHLFEELMLRRRLHDERDRVGQKGLLRFDHSIDDATPALTMDHALPLQILQRQAHRCSRYIKLRGQSHFRRKPRAGGQTAVGDPFLNVANGSRPGAIVDDSEGIRLFQGHRYKKNFKPQSVCRPGEDKGERILFGPYFRGIDRSCSRKWPLLQLAPNSCATDRKLAPSANSAHPTEGGISYQHTQRQTLFKGG
jgi:hypothetical protein